MVEPKKPFEMERVMRVVVLDEMDWCFVRNLVCDMRNELRVNSRKSLMDGEYHDNHVAPRYNRILNCFADARKFDEEELERLFEYA